MHFLCWCRCETQGSDYFAKGEGLFYNVLFYWAFWDSFTTRHLEELFKLLSESLIMWDNSLESNTLVNNHVNKSFSSISLIKIFKNGSIV